MLTAAPRQSQHATFAAAFVSFCTVFSSCALMPLPSAVTAVLPITRSRTFARMTCTPTYTTRRTAGVKRPWSISFSSESTKLRMASPSLQRWIVVERSEVKRAVSDSCLNRCMQVSTRNDR